MPDCHSITPMTVLEKIVAGAYHSTTPFPAGYTNDDILARSAHWVDAARLRGVFRDDLLTEHGITGHPKAEKAFMMAWEHGHSSGYAEIAAYFSRLVELIR